MSFQISFQSVMFSPDEHIRQVFVLICAYSSFVKFLSFVHGTLPPYDIVYRHLHEDSDQHVLPRSLIRDFVVRMKDLCILGYPKCGQ